MRHNRPFIILGVLAAVLAMQTAARADGDPSTWPKKPMFSVRLGSYFANSTGQIRVDGYSGEGTVVDLQDVLKIPNNPTVFRARADVRVAGWFGVEGEYYGFTRSRSATIDQEITIGDDIFPINETISSHFSQNYLDLSLKFYLLHRERFDLGLWVGANIHFPSFTLDSTPSDLSVSRKTWYPIPALGIVFNYTILPRLYFYGKAGYFKYSDSTANISFDSTRFDISLDYYFWKSLGVGATYEYYDSSIEKHTSAYSGTIANRIAGFQIYAVIGF